MLVLYVARAMAVAPDNCPDFSQKPDSISRLEARHFRDGRAVYAAGAGRWERCTAGRRPPFISQVKTRQ